MTTEPSAHREPSAYRKPSAQNEGSEKKEFSVEKSLKRLEMYVEALEQGEVNLDQAFKIFEKAVSLSKRLRKKLEQYERKIEIITKKSTETGQFETEPFPEEE